MIKGIGINQVNSSANTNKNISKTEKTNISTDGASVKSAKKYDSIEINKLIEDNDKRINDFKESIRKMISKQGETSNLTLFGQELTVSVEDSQKSAESIKDGGEYSVDVVANRIMDMAMALSNGDKSKISLLKDAVNKGFEAAGLEFNNSEGLPEICNKTYDEVMKRFDEWENDSE